MKTITMTNNAYTIKVVPAVYDKFYVYTDVLPVGYGLGSTHIQGGFINYGGIA